MTDDQLSELKEHDIEVYLILKYGSLHGGYLAWCNTRQDLTDADNSIENFFNFLDFIIDYQSKQAKNEV